MMSGFIDIEKWKRREHFHLYRGFANPFWSLCADVDVTQLWQQSRHVDGPSFSIGAIYLALAAANETEAFRLRIRGDQVWLHDQVDMGTTILRDDDTFSFAFFPMAPQYADFETVARTETDSAKRSQTLRIPAEARDNVIYHSTIPWIRFTAFTNAVGRGDDCIPRMVFGRCTEEAGRWRMPVSVEVHHALVDGLDVARFFEKFEQRLSQGCKV
jgi:chloramphenicol O-acetyltransferase type A